MLAHIAFKIEFQASLEKSVSLERPNMNTCTAHIYKNRYAVCIDRAEMDGKGADKNLHSQFSSVRTHCSNAQPQIQFSFLLLLSQIIMRYIISRSKFQHTTGELQQQHRKLEPVSQFLGGGNCQATLIIIHIIITSSKGTEEMRTELPSPNNIYSYTHSHFIYILMPTCKIIETA
jgi:hypothetical protein